MKTHKYVYILYHKYSPFYKVNLLFAENNLWIPKDELIHLFGVSVNRISRIIDKMKRRGEASIGGNSLYLPIPKSNIISQEKCIHIELALKIGEEAQAEILSDFREWVENQLSLLN